MPFLVNFTHQKCPFSGQYPALFSGYGKHYLHFYADFFKPVGTHWVGEDILFFVNNERIYGHLLLMVKTWADPERGGGRGSVILDLWRTFPNEQSL